MSSFNEMNTIANKKTLILAAATERDMLSIGECIGKQLFPSAFIALYGDLGAGKTTLVKGIASALGITDISSPTFTIVRSHKGRLKLEHFDAYRIQDADELTAIGFEDYVAGDGVIVMEWCENVPDVLPADRLEIHILGSGRDPRSVTLTAIGDEYSPIMEALKVC